MPEEGCWELLLVDDEPDDCREAKEFIEGEVTEDTGKRFHVSTLNNFNEALSALEKHYYDILILDVHVGPVNLSQDEGVAEEGIRVLDAIKSKQFIPIIFYTKLPIAVKELATGAPIIQIVEKAMGVEALMTAITDILKTGVPAVNRAMIHHLQEKQRDYMWDFAARNQAELVGSSGSTDLAYLLARRLALSLSGPDMRRLAESLGGSSCGTGESGLAHPMRYYIMPPIEEDPLAGDIYKYKNKGNPRYAVLLTPSCDFVGRNGKQKAQKVLFARCNPLTFQKEFRDWKKTGYPEGDKRASLKELLSDHRRKSQSGRFHCLPGALSLPDLIVDFQQLFMLPRRNLNDLSKMERLASLDSPFAESLLAKFAQYFGRLGTPDLDTDYIIERTKPK
jgi:CheY-like chemotaxis protein